VNIRLGRLAAGMRRHPIRSLVLALLLGLLGVGGYRVGLSFYADHHLQAADEAEARYEFDEAEKHLAKCLWAQPRSATLHFRMARAARRANHFDDASLHLKKCQQLEGKNPENALEALLLRVETGDIAEVERLLQEQVDQESLDANLILEALAKGYVQTYRLDAAMHCVNRLLAREPDNVLALLVRASLQKTAGNNPKAEEDYRRAIAAQPDHREARRQFGEFLLSTKQHEEALSQFEYLRQRPGGDASEILLGLARSHRQMGHTETARQILDELLARNPDDRHALVERGKVALETESPTAAEKWLRQAVAAYPFDAQGNYLLGQCLLAQGREEEAHPYQAARTRIEGDLKALETAFRRVVKAPRDPAPRLEAGLICLRNGQPDEGERWLLSALDMAPGDEPTRTALADHYERTGQPELAASYRRPAQQPTESERVPPSPPHPFR
jgi:Tfp pilus assembly protein PilF